MFCTEWNDFHDAFDFKIEEVKFDLIFSFNGFFRLLIKITGIFKIYLYIKNNNY